MNLRKQSSIYTIVMGVFVLGIFIYHIYNHIYVFKDPYFANNPIIYKSLLILRKSYLLILSIILIISGFLFYRNKKYGFEMNLLSMGMLLSLSLIVIIRFLSIHFLQLATPRNYIPRFDFNVLSYLVILIIIPTLYFILQSFINKEILTNINYSEMDNYEENIRKYVITYLLITGIILIGFFAYYVNYFLIYLDDWGGIASLYVFQYGKYLNNYVLFKTILLIIGLLNLVVIYVLLKKSKYTYQSLLTVSGFTFLVGLTEFFPTIFGLKFIRDIERHISSPLNISITTIIGSLHDSNMVIGRLVFGLTILILSIGFIIWLLLNRKELHFYLIEEKEEE